MVDAGDGGQPAERAVFRGAGAVGRARRSQRQRPRLATGYSGYLGLMAGTPGDLPPVGACSPSLERSYQQLIRIRRTRGAKRDRRAGIGGGNRHRYDRRMTCGRRRQAETTDSHWATSNSPTSQASSSIRSSRASDRYAAGLVSNPFFQIGSNAPCARCFAARSSCFKVDRNCCTRAAFYLSALICIRRDRFETGR